MTDTNAASVILKRAIDLSDTYTLLSYCSFLYFTVVLTTLQFSVPFFIDLSAVSISYLLQLCKRLEQAEFWVQELNIFFGYFLS